VPIRRSSGDHLALQLLLPEAQRLFVDFHLRTKPTKVRGLLGGHSAVLFQIDRFVCHGAAASRSSAA
jgi:hypothetical protein